jgi:hypothetical protein
MQLKRLAAESSKRIAAESERARFAVQYEMAKQDNSMLKQQLRSLPSAIAKQTVQPRVGSKRARGLISEETSFQPPKTTAPHHWLSNGAVKLLLRLALCDGHVFAFSKSYPQPSTPKNRVDNECIPWDCILVSCRMPPAQHQQFSYGVLKVAAAAQHHPSQFTMVLCFFYGL